LDSIIDVYDFKLSSEQVTGFRFGRCYHTVNTSEAHTDNAERYGERRAVFTSGGEPCRWQVSGQVEGDCFEENDRGNKAAASPEQPRHCLLYDRTLEEVGLQASLGAECPQCDVGCVGNE
jgi:hypothetical protein